MFKNIGSTCIGDRPEGALRPRSSGTSIRHLRPLDPAPHRGVQPLNALIRFSLSHRLLIVSVAILIACLPVASLALGGAGASPLPIDIFPDLTRPRVTVMTEAVGLAPEEVEALITVPLETAFNGASGVESVRSSSGPGLSVVFVEFGWGTDIRVARQVVQERISLVSNRLPETAKPQMAPISSITGQIMTIGMWSQSGYTSPMQIRTLADWVVRPQLLAIPGVAQVVIMGGDRKQFQVLVNPESLLSYGVTLREVEDALRSSNSNATGGYLEQGSTEYMVRVIGRAQSLADLEKSVVKRLANRSVLVGDVARVVEGGEIKRGDSSINGRAGVVLTITKQPGSDTRRLTGEVATVLSRLRRSLPDEVVLSSDLYQQKSFIDLGIRNVAEALRDGALLILVVLLLFLLNLRTTFITLTAIPLSIAVAGLVFWLLGLSINVMTLGGLAVAMGELVDDAIVDIENVFRRLRQNALLDNPEPVLRVVYHASLEVRGAIVYGTILVILVFVPVFALSGIEGRLFTPLAIAYIVSILASLLVSVTVTPVLASILLPRSLSTHKTTDSPFLGMMKRLARPVIKISLSRAGLAMVLVVVGSGIVASGVILSNLGMDFLPPFDEGASQVNITLPPGASLETSNRISRMIDQRFGSFLRTKDNPRGPIRSFIRRSGRAELDEHAEGVNITEYIVTFNPDSGLTRDQAIARLRSELAQVPGIESEVGQPLAHLISHMLSGVSAQLAIKVYGDDLDVLRRKTTEIRNAIHDVRGLAQVVVEPQRLVPQLRIELDRERLALHGLTPGYVNDFVETAIHGKTVSSILEGQRTFDLIVRLDDAFRTDYANLHRLSLDLPGGGRVPLSAVAHVYEGGGPNTIHREQVRRRITIRANAQGRDLAGVVADVRRIVEEKVILPEGYFVEYGGQFQAQEEATRRIAMLGLVSIVGVFLTLYTLFPSARIVAQIMVSVPVAFAGGVAGLYLTGQSLTVAGLVGFISLSGIASRNGILLVSHYLHLMREEGEPFTGAMVIRGSLERLAPVLMTSLTAGLGLLPLVLGGRQPGREILYPVATVILGGLVTSTCCEYLVHPGLFRWFSGSDAVRLASAINEDAPEVTSAPTTFEPGASA